MGSYQIQLRIHVLHGILGKLVSPDLSGRKMEEYSTNVGGICTSDLLVSLGWKDIEKYTNQEMRVLHMTRLHAQLRLQDYIRGQHHHHSVGSRKGGRDDAGMERHGSSFEEYMHNKDKEQHSGGRHHPYRGSNKRCSYGCDYERQSARVGAMSLMLREMVTEIDPWITPLIGIGLVHTRWKQGAKLGRARTDMEIQC